MRHESGMHTTCSTVQLLRGNLEKKHLMSEYLFFKKKKLNFLYLLLKNTHIPCKGRELIYSDSCRRLLPISIILQFISLQTGGTAEIKTSLECK